MVQVPAFLPSATMDFKKPSACSQTCRQRGVSHGGDVQ